MIGVTGATGQLGGRVARRLAAAGGSAAPGAAGSGSRAGDPACRAWPGVVRGQGCAPAFSLAEAAEQLTAAWDRPIRYEAETLDEAYRSRERYGAPAREVAGWVSSYAAISSGELSGVSSAVEDITGHLPVGLAEYLAR